MLDIDMKKMIYADNAATTKLDTEAFEVMKDYLYNDYSNPSQPYSFSRNAKNAINESRKVIAKCIGASPEEIYFTSGGTESDNWAIKGSMKYGDNRSIITSNIEHHAVLNTCKYVESMGYPVSYLPSDNKGLVLPEILCNIITNNTKLVSVMMANNEIGTIEPISDLVKVAHNMGALFHTDAVQAVGHIPINVKDLDVDMLSASAHKFNGPKGIGFLYIKNETHINPLINGGAQENSMRAGTENLASIVAMATALKNNCKTLSENSAMLLKLENAFLNNLKKANVDFIRNGHKNHIPGNISISIKNSNGEMLLHRLDLKGICISTGSACDSVNTQVSHVINAINVPKEYAEGTVRISFGKENTIEDAMVIAKEITNIVGR